MSWSGLSVRLALRAIASPRLAADLLRVAWRFRTRDWYRRPPFLPLPDRAYVAWRMHTAYGDHNAVPPVTDVIRYARWARRMP
ncbi:MAG: hypothetical protein IT356_10325 [Gemmatimonadaceae bacterium]|nr:hypothetical protein [Gemmatimonadaceae bacterium]